MSERGLGRIIVKNTVFLTLGNVVLKALTFLFNVYVIRRLVDDRFGKYSIVLAFVGLGSVALLGALLGLRPRRPSTAYWLAVAGAGAFCIQTAVLDLFVWTAYFHA